MTNSSHPNLAVWNLLAANRETLATIVRREASEISQLPCGHNQDRSCGIIFPGPK